MSAHSWEGGRGKSKPCRDCSGKCVTPLLMLFFAELTAVGEAAACGPSCLDQLGMHGSFAS